MGRDSARSSSGSDAQRHGRTAATALAFELHLDAEVDVCPSVRVSGEALHSICTHRAACEKLTSRMQSRIPRVARNDTLERRPSIDEYRLHRLYLRAASRRDQRVGARRITNRFEVLDRWKQHIQSRE